MEQKFYSFLGLARRAGKVLLGYDMLERYKGKIYAAVTASDAAERTIRNIERLCADVECVSCDCTKAELGKLLGVREVSVAAITDKGFAEQIILNGKRSK